MIAYGFRRLRFEMIAVAVALAGVGMLALITGRAMHHQYTSSGLADCLATAAERDECRALLNAFSDKFNSLTVLIVPLVLLPALFGAFVGGPLVARDVEAGTHRFFWTQSVTRRRWLASSTGALLVAAAVSGLIFSLITGAWLHITNRVTDERLGDLYEIQGIVPIAATVMAAAMGVLAGAVLRRTLPAMAVTIGSFIVVRVVLAVLVRPRLMSPVTLESEFFGGNPLDGSGAWVLSEQMVDSAGNVLAKDGTLNVAELIGTCPSLPTGTGDRPGVDKVDACLRELGAHQVTRYHPGDRFWTFQILESLIMLGITAAVVGAAFWVVRRRIS